MLRALAAILFVSFISSACTQRTICPAFQSAFIYDKDELRKRFSYLQEDSTPKIYTASKNRYLVAEQTSYRKKVKSFNTVPLKPIYVDVPDSFKIKEEDGLLGEEGIAGEDGVDPGSELDRAARSVIDSVYIEDVPPQPVATAEDSIYVITKDKETRVLKYNFPDSLIYDENTGRYVAQKPTYAVVHVTFNVDQDNYMWYLKDYLVLPDVKQSRILQEARNEEAERGGGSSRKKSGGFFRRLFGKKDKSKQEEEPAPVRRSEEEEFDFIDEDPQPEEAEISTEEKKEKKGLFRKKDKKPKEPKKKPQPEKQEDIPEEEDELIIPDNRDVDGF